MEHHLNQRISDLELQVSNLTNVINALRIALTASMPVQHQQQHQHQHVRPFYSNNNNNYRRTNPRDLFKKAQYESSLSNMADPVTPAPSQPTPVANAPTNVIATSVPEVIVPKTIKKRIVKSKEATLEDVLNS